MPKLRLVVGWVLLGVLLLFIVLNLKSVDVQFLIMEVKMPTAFVILLSAGLGAGAVYAFQYFKSAKREPR
jgi:uncharacterized integral membrane protein